jgi:hypothetical protein
MPKERSYEIRFVNDWPVKSATVNGKSLPPSAIAYDGNTATASVTIPRSSTRKSLNIAIQRAAGWDDLDIATIAGEIKRLRDSMKILNATWPTGWAPDSLVRAAQTGERISIHPEKAAEELAALRRMLPAVVSDMDAVNGDRSIVERALRHLNGVYTVEIRHAVTVH